MTLLLTILILLLPAAPQLYAAEQLTLSEALEIALKTHPQASEAAAEADGAAARTEQLRATYYPQVKLDVEWNKGRSYLNFFKSSRETEGHSAALTLRQTIYDFGRSSGTLDAAQGEHDAAIVAQAVSRQEITQRVRSAYHLLLAAEKQVIAIESNLKSREDTLRQAREFHAGKSRPKLDVARAETSFYSARSALSRAESNREIARMELSTSMGLKFPLARPLTEPAASTGPSGDLPGMQRQAMQRRGELRRLTALYNSAKSLLQSAKSGHLPLLEGNAAIGYAGKEFFNDGTIWEVGINLSIPLFSGFSTTNKEREAVARISSIEAQQESLRIKTLKEVEAAWFGIRDAEDRLELSDKERAAAREMLSLAMTRYRDGSGSIIELTDAQALALDAENAHIQAEFDRGIALASLTRAIGSE